MQLWLRAKPLRQAVLARIAEHYDGYADLDAISFRIGGGITIRSLRLHETASARSSRACEIDRVDVHGSFWDLWRGAFQPTAITASGVCLRIRESAEGKWSVALPVRRADSHEQQLAFPIQVENGRIEFIPAKPLAPLSVKKLTGLSVGFTGTADGSSIEFSGRCEDSLWGLWRVAGGLSCDDGQLHVRIRTSSLRPTAKQAEWLGHDVAEIWSTLQPAGEIAVDAELFIDPDSEVGLRYQVLVDPVNASLRLPVIPERIREVAGRIEITPDQVRLHSLVGRLKTGEVSTTGLVMLDPPSFNLAADFRQVPLDDLLGRILGEVAQNRPISGAVRLQGALAPETWTGTFDGTFGGANEAADAPLDLHAAIQDGVLRLRDLRFDCFGGSIEGHVHVPLRANGLIEGAATLKSVELASLWPLLGEPTAGVAGAADGRLEFAVPVESWTDRSTWQWTGHGRLQNARFGDVLFTSIDGRLNCRERGLLLSDATALLSGRRLVGEVRIGLDQPYAISGRFEMDPVPLAQFSAVPDQAVPSVAVSGELRASGSLSGTLSPPEINIEGSAQLRRLAIAGGQLGDATLHYVMKGNGFDFDRTEFRAFGGRLHARGRWSWASNSPATGSILDKRTATEARDNLKVEGEFENVDASLLLATAVPDDFQVQGRVNGHVSIDWPLDARRGDETGRVMGSIRASQLRVGSVAVENATADFVRSGDDFSVPRWSAAVAAGQLAGSATLESDPTGRTFVVQASSTGLDVSKLVGDSVRQSRGWPIRGRASAAGTLRIDLSSGGLVGAGTARCQALTVDGLPPIESVAGPLELRGNELVMRDFRATLWGGSANGTLQVDLNDQSPRPVHVVLDRVEGVQLAQPAESWPALRGKVRGKLTGHGEFSVRDDAASGRISGSGQFSVQSASVFGVPVSLAEGTLTAGEQSARPTNESTQPENPATRATRPIRDSVFVHFKNVRAAKGTAQGQLMIAWSQPVAYDARFRFDGVDLGTVAQSVFGSPHPVTGSLAGVAHLYGAGPNARDVHGDLRLRLSDAHLWPYPVFAVIAKVLNLSLSKSGAFKKGEGTASLKNGTLTFNDLRLEGDAVKLLGEGTVNADGEIKMEVIGNVEAPVLKNVPVLGAVQKALGYVQRRLVKIRLTGTLDEPEAMPVPLQDLSEPAVRFFKEVLERAGFETADPNAKSMSRPPQQLQEFTHPERVVRPRP